MLAVVTLVTAYFSEVYYKPDEHFQILEFLSYKLGRTSPAELPWEFNAGIRPWMQPWLYFLVAKPMTLVGIQDPFTIVFVLQILTGFASLGALAVFADAMVADLASLDQKLTYLRFLPAFGFLPYLFVRTSSETMSATFFVAGLALVMRNAPAVSVRRLVAAGLLLGLAFECRYQSGLLIFGLVLWLALVKRMSLRSLVMLALGGLGAVVLALLVDRWGYGDWSFPVWGYFRENILNGVASGRFGADPIYGYVYLVPANLFFPILVLLLVAMVVVWLRNPRHAVTWTTLPYVVIHCLLAHKEARFFFPLAMMATSFPVLAFAPSKERALPVFDRCWAYRDSLVIKAIGGMSVAAMALLAVYPAGVWAHHVPMAKYLYRHFPDELVAYSYARIPFQSYPMYRPRHLQSTKLNTPEELESLLDQGPVYLFSDTPALDDVLPEDAHATLLFSEMPFASSARLASLATRLVQAYPRTFKSGALLSLFRIERKRPTPSGDSQAGR